MESARAAVRRAILISESPGAPLTLIHRIIA
jgi:hypothetical protein